MRRAAIYLRVSSDEQAGPGHVSLSVQEQRCRAYATQHGWTIAAVESDAESGLKTTRTGYQRVIALARDAAIDCVVVAMASRFGRRASEVLTRVEELRGLGVELHSTAEDLSSFLMLGIQAIMSEEESRRISERVGPAKRLRASQGYWLGHAPFGTVNEKGILKPGPHFDLVRLAFELAAAGVASREINRRLNALLAPRVLHLTTVRKMLRNPVYAGRVVWDGIDAPALWEPLIDLQVFAGAGAQLTRRYRERAPLSPAYPFWVVGMAFCGRCGARMLSKVEVRRWGKRYAYLICGRVDRVQVKRSCRPEHFLIEEVQARVLEQLEVYRIDASSADAYLARLAERQAASASDRQRRIDALRSERERLLGRLQTAKAAHLDDPATFTMADVRQVQAAIKDNVAAIDHELAQPGDPAGDAIDVEDVRRFLTQRDWLELRDTEPAAFRAWLQRWIIRVDVIDRGHYDVVWSPLLTGVTAPSN